MNDKLYAIRRLQLIDNGTKNQYVRERWYCGGRYKYDTDDKKYFNDIAKARQVLNKLEKEDSRSGFVLIEFEIKPKRIVEEV